MVKFQGFTNSETFTPLPDSFFRQLLNEIDDADELKVTLYALWRIGNTEGRVHALQEVDFAALLPDPSPALEKSVSRGTLILVRKETSAYYFLNSPRGRAAAESLQAGDLNPESLVASAPPPERPNLFRLYEENIGPLTPLIADALKDAEQTYPPEWAAEALEIAVKKNKRNWKYVEAILKRWKEQGQYEAKNKQGAPQNTERYTKSEFDEYFK